jgi:hypothetical protein
VKRQDSAAKRTRADFVTARSIIEWAEMRCRVLSVTDIPAGVLLRIQPDRAFSEPLNLYLTAGDWVTVVGYSLSSEGWT